MILQKKKKKKRGGKEINKQKKKERGRSIKERKKERMKKGYKSKFFETEASFGEGVEQLNVNLSIQETCSQGQFGITVQNCVIQLLINK